MAIRDHDLHLYNSLSRRKERFEPLVPGHVGMYVCGPTVYSETHLGHAKSYVSFDVIVRYFRYLGYRVRYVQNITDVGHLTDDADEGEDKILKAARLDQVHPMELAERYTRFFYRDMDALGVQRPDISPRASQHIPEQIALIRRLVDSGHAYVVGGNVYFSVDSFPDYGALSGRQTEEGREGHRVEVREDKRDPRDFALWKLAEGGHILRWESPWGWGYPGWHIECSAMSVKYLGEAFDIHGGGLDNQFPHHECEIAQSRAAGMPFARSWLHNNLITVDGQKMSKSLGNFVAVQDALRTHEPEVIRFWILGTHYRSPANCTVAALDSAREGLGRLRNCVRALDQHLAKVPKEGSGGEELLAATAEAEAAFVRSMDDDFNTPVAMAALFELVRGVNTALTSASSLPAAPWRQARECFQVLAGDVLGILPEGERATGLEADPLVDLLVEIRSELKARKAYDLGDRIRDQLGRLGIEIKDDREGTSWSRK